MEEEREVSVQAGKKSLLFYQRMQQYSLKLIAFLNLTDRLTLCHLNLAYCGWKHPRSRRKEINGRMEAHWFSIVFLLQSNLVVPSCKSIDMGAVKQIHQ